MRWFAALVGRERSRRTRLLFGCGLAGIAFAALIVALGIGRSGSGAPPAPARPSAPASALRFEPNRGQMEDRIRFLARGPGYGLFLTDNGATLALRRGGRREPATSTPPTLPAFEQRAITMRVVGGAPGAPRGLDRLPGVSHHFRGNDPTRWRTNVEGYARAWYPRVRPGLDLVFYAAAEQRLEYDLVLDPGVDLSQVAVAFEGLESLSIDASGSAILRLPNDGGANADVYVRQPPPLAYQLDERGDRMVLAARYEKRGGATLGFHVDGYDRRRPLVVDPVLVYSTYLGGQADDEAYAVATRDGDAYIAGYTVSTNFPTAGASRPYGGAGDVFVSKLTYGGAALIYSTYLGGSSTDIGLGIAVDSGGNAYVTGYTWSADFPVASAFQPAPAGASDAFVAKLDPSGSNLVYSTYLGGPGEDYGQGIAVDASARAHITGQSYASGFPLAAPLQGTFGGQRDVFVTRLAAAGNALLFSTYLGGSQADSGQGIALDSAGNTYVTGFTHSPNFPTVAAIQPTLGRIDVESDAFVSKLAPNGSSLVYSTYLGGNDFEIGYGIAVDNPGNAYVVGYTASTDFPTSPEALQASLAGGSDVFVTKLSPLGSSRIFSTYLGGDLADLAYGVGVDGAGNAYITGYTWSANFPKASPLQPALGGGQDAFLVQLPPTGKPLLLSTHRGGAGTDYGTAIAVSNDGTVQIAGYTNSSNFPTVAPMQSARAGLMDAFVIGMTAPVPWGREGAVIGLGLCLLAIGVRNLNLRPHRRSDERRPP